MDLKNYIGGTAFGWWLGVIALVSAPIAFLSQWGATWTLACASVGLWLWWWNSKVKARTKKAFIGPKATPPPKVRLSARQWGELILWALFPLAVTLGFIVMVSLNIYGLDLWRKDYTHELVRIERHGSTYTHFGTKANTTPNDRTRWNRDQWIRWMWDGVTGSESGAALLFIEGEQFREKYRTIIVEVHNTDAKILPGQGCAAFLVRDSPGDPWYRPIYRQVGCEQAGDGNTRLFRVTAWNPDPGERLWIFLNVAPRSETIALDSLNLQLLVEP